MEIIKPGKEEVEVKKQDPATLPETWDPKEEEKKEKVKKQKIEKEALVSEKPQPKQLLIAKGTSDAPVPTKFSVFMKALRNFYKWMLGIGFPQKKWVVDNPQATTMITQLLGNAEKQELAHFTWIKQNVFDQYVSNFYEKRGEDSQATFVLLTDQKTALLQLLASSYKFEIDAVGGEDIEHILRVCRALVCFLYL